MKIKRYFARDMRQAIRKVREEQGPDAVILSNRRVEGGVELVVAVDYDESLLDRATQNEPEPAGPAAADLSQQTSGAVPVQAAEKPTAQDPASGQPDQAVVWTQDPAIVDMRREIHELRGLLENQLAHLAWADFNRRQPHSAGLLRRLMDFGLPAAHCEALVNQLGDIQEIDQAWRYVQDLLAEELLVTDDDILSRGGIVALVGPTGVGKTTTVAKLAARYALRNGQRSIALVTTDSYRIGAHEQLITYGRILGVPVQVASDADELQATLKNLMDRNLVLIDTAGMGQRDLRLSEQFAILSGTGTPIQTYLVLSATTQTAVHDEVLRTFDRTLLKGCILSKVDEAMSLGGLLSLLIQKQLPLAYVANGQRVPEDLHPARGKDLVGRAAQLTEQLRVGTDHETLAQRFGRIAANAHI